MKLIGLAILTALIAAAPAQAAPAVEKTISLSGTPGYLTSDSQGNAWVALDSSSTNRELARVSPDGTVTEFDTPNNLPVIGVGLGPKSLSDASEQIWLSQNGAVIRFDPIAGSGQLFAVANLNGARAITSDKSGYIWVVDDQDGLLRIDPGLGTVLDEIKVPGSSGRGIALGSDGNLFWADFAQGTINKTLTTSPFTTTSFAVGGGPQEIAAGPEGQLAYSNPGAVPQEVGTINTDGLTSKTTAPLTDPFGVTFASDGNYYYANFASNDLASLTRQLSYQKSVAFAAASGPRYLSAGKPGTIWVGLQTSRQLALVSGIPTAAAKENFTSLVVSPKSKRLRRGGKFRLTIRVYNSGGVAGQALVQLKANRRLKLAQAVKIAVPAGQSAARQITVRGRKSGIATIKVTINNLNQTSRVRVRR